jgi:hypothetical protein
VHLFLKTTHVAHLQTPAGAISTTTEQAYEGDSNENVKSAIKIQNTARLSCKLTIMILMVRRVAERWQYDAGMQHDGEVVV